MELAGQAALVTGSAVRVGRAIAWELARGGCDVLVHYRGSEAEARQLADQIAALGRRSAIVQADLACPREACATLLAAADAAFGRLDLLVNNAALYAPGSPGEMDPAGLAELFAVNATAPAMLAEQAAQRMAGGAGGAIVNVLDIQARRPWPKYLAYAMSKAALWSATAGLARRFAPAVRVNGVAPGAVLWNERDSQAVRRRAIEQTPLGRAGRPEDVAAAVRMLLENDYITGQVIVVDGGRSMAID